jgi:hypothetical protein
MISRWLPVIVLVGAFSPSFARAQHVLTPDAEVGFKRLIKLVESGAAGRAIHTANVAMQKSTVRIELVGSGGVHHSFVVRSIEDGGARTSRFFAIAPGPDSTSADAAVLGRLLDQSFQFDPFTLPPQAGESGFAVRDAPSVAEAWNSGGLSSASFAVLRASLRPAPRSYAYPVIALHLLCLLGCLAFVWRSRPGQS